MIKFFYFFLVIENKIDWKIDRRMLNNKAYQKPSTSKPETKASHIRMMTAFITRRKRPNVKMVTGSVNTMRIGLTNMLRTVSTAATTTAVKKPDTLIPGKIFARTTTAIALSTISTSVFCVLFCFIRNVKVADILQFVT